jgi:Flp pilus assembly protein TadD
MRRCKPDLRGIPTFSNSPAMLAQADFAVAIRLNPKNNYAHHELGLTLAKRGDLARATAPLTDAITSE